MVDIIEFLGFRVDVFMGCFEVWKKYLKNYYRMFGDMKKSFNFVTDFCKNNKLTHKLYG